MVVRQQSPSVRRLQDCKLQTISTPIETTFQFESQTFFTALFCSLINFTVFYSMRLRFSQQMEILITGTTRPTPSTGNIVRNIVNCSTLADHDTSVNSTSCIGDLDGLTTPVSQTNSNSITTQYHTSAEPRYIGKMWRNKGRRNKGR